jgi:ribosomal protein L7/L12
MMSYRYKTVHMRHPGPWYGVLAFVAVGVFASLGLRQRRQLGARAERLRETPSVIPREVIDLLCQGKKIRAIKRYRELTEGVDLRQAKYVINNVGQP